MALTPKESAFVEACRAAGYAGNENTLAVQANRLLRKPKVAEAIKARQAKTNSVLVANRVQRQEFWTEVMKDVGAEMRDRLKASELLGRSEADFTDKLAGPDGEALSVSIAINGVKK